jgi:hypothetical protein
MDVDQGFPDGAGRGWAVMMGGMGTFADAGKASVALGHAAPA